MNRQKRLLAMRAACQNGQIIILMVLSLALGTGFVVYSMAGSRTINAQKIAETEAAFAQAKQALISWSASRTPTVGSPNIRPGELPCPDMNDNGLDDDGSCSAGAIGRIPWQTLGIPRPRDGTGETLWYAVSGPYRYKYSASTPPITSDTLGNLTVYQGSSATTQTSQAIAVLFAPNSPTGTQVRGTATATCSTTGTTIQQRYCAANYLESTGGGNNAQTSGPFIQATASANFNDRVVSIVSADLMPLLEKRVAREVMFLLNRYRAGEGSYPWADLADGDSNGGPSASDGYYNRNRFPCGNAKPTNWGSLPTPIVLPDWLTNGCPDTATGFVTGWSSVIYYAVAKNRLDGAGSSCTVCFATSTLTVTNPSSGIADLCTTVAGVFSCTPTVISNGSADLLLITSGSATGARASGWSNSSFGAISGYFQDSENSDNNDDTYIVPSSTQYDRNRLFIIR